MNCQPAFKSVSIHFLLLLSIGLPFFAQSQDNPPLRKSTRYAIFSDRVEQKPYVAKAISSTEITSNYQSEANLFIRPSIEFKFSINGKDNEMSVGVNHHINCLSGQTCETPLIEFGKQFNDQSGIPEGVFLKADTKLKIRLDMRKVFEQFAAKGFYENFSGQKIYKEDFKGVFIAGNLSPLTWDFDNLHNYSNLQLRDENGDHVYELTLVLNKKKDKKVTSSAWKSSLDTSPYPQYKSDFLLQDAIYNLSLEEMIRAVEKDSTLRTGKEWAGVWTRDVSYSIILSMAILQPKVAKYSLMRKVKNGMIIQDTGTGGAYPISTDRMIWAVAAYEIYKVTGEKEWLKTVYPIIKKSLEADLLNAIDPVTGLVKGESSFLDWREQTYPVWMEPADIYESQCLGTNAAHFQAHKVLSSMATALGIPETAEKHSLAAERIKNAVNENLWIQDKGYYGQFLYGRNYKMISPKSEALGEALCVLFDIADAAKQKSIISKTPVTEFGITCIYPQIPNIPPYHNNAVWPFVQSYWTMACAKVGNENAVMESLSAIWRPSALFLTNKENFVAGNGDFIGTQVNSDNMLWSLSGNISMVYKVLFGIQYGANELNFKPFVPKMLRGKRVLNNYKYRDAILNIEVTGFGNEIGSFFIDGQVQKNAVIRADLKGIHNVRIALKNIEPGGEFNMSPNLISPEMPVLSLAETNLTWKAIADADQYKVFRNGKPVSTTKDTLFTIMDKTFGEYQVVAVTSAAIESFASEPVIFSEPDNIQRIELEQTIPAAPKPYKGFSGSGFIETSVGKNSSFSFQVEAKEEGMYAIDFRYANGNGPVNTENKCAIRGFSVNNVFAGTIVFPQRGTNEWSEWGYSNSVNVKLNKGVNSLVITYDPQHTNMNVEVNEAVIDYARIIKM